MAYILWLHVRVKGKRARAQTIAPVDELARFLVGSRKILTSNGLYFNCFLFENKNAVDRYLRYTRANKHVYLS